MMDLEFSFDPPRWEKELESLKQGSTVSGAHLLALLETEEEQTVLQVLEELTEKGVSLSTRDLPAQQYESSTALRMKQEKSFSKTGINITVLDETDPLRLYLEELAQTPVAGDPQLLAERFAQGEESVAQQLTELCLSAVLEEACAVAGQGVLLLDLIQEGNLGLWQSIMCYETGNFEEHARWYIRQYLARALFMQARSAGVGGKLKQDMQDYVDADQRLLAELGRNPTAQEIGQLLHISEQEALSLEQMVLTARTLHQAKADGKPQEIEQEEDQAVEDTAYFQSRQRIAELLSGLSQQESKLISLRYGLEGGLPLSAQQTAQTLGLTAEDVVRIEADALKKLRDQ